jgi:hypothetical protein
VKLENRWKRLTVENVPEVVTVTTLRELTGLGRSTIQGKISRWVSDGVIEPVGYGPRGVIFYRGSDVAKLAENVPDVGNRTTGKSRSAAAMMGWATRRARAAEAAERMTSGCDEESEDSPGVE